MKKIIVYFLIFLNFSIYSSVINQDIDISNMKLNDVLMILSKESEENIICSQEAKNLVIDTYFFKGDSIDFILESLVEANDLEMTEVNNIRIITTRAENFNKKSKIIGKIYDLENNRALSGVKIEIKNTLYPAVYSDNNGNFIIDNINKDVYLLKVSKKDYLENGEILDVNKKIHSLNIGMKKLENIKEVISDKEKINQLNFFEIDGKLQYSHSISLYNSSVDEIKEILKNSFGENIKVSSFSKNNKIVMVAEKDILNNAIEIIKDLDQNPRQVKITSEILDISNNLFEELGFGWVYDHKPNKSNGENLKAGLIGKGSITAGGVFNMVRQFNSGNDVLSLGLNLLETTDDIVVSSIPTIMISSGEEGEFKITEEVIVGEKREKNSSKDRNYTVEPIFKEAGLIIKVKPSIKEDDNVLLDISLELSDFKFKKNIVNITEENSGTYNSEGGSKIGRVLNTTVRVKNGDTILLGGLKKSIKQNLESKIPILGDIPIINFFFKNFIKKNDNSDMYIKIKVEIEE